MQLIQWIVNTFALYARLVRGFWLFLCTSFVSISLLLFLDVTTLSDPALRTALLLAPLAGGLFGMLPPSSAFKSAKMSAALGGLYAGILPFAYMAWIGYSVDNSSLAILSFILAGLGVIWGLACHLAQRSKEASHAIHLLIDLPGHELEPMLRKSFSNLGPSVLDDSGGATVYQLQTDSRYCIGLETAIDPPTEIQDTVDDEHDDSSISDGASIKESCIVTFGYAPISTWGHSMRNATETAPIDVLETMRSHFSQHLSEFSPTTRIQPLG